MLTQAREVSPPVADLAKLLGELQEVVDRHGATGFALMFAPQGITLPQGYVLVQQVDTATGTITLVPTRIDECELTDVLHEIEAFDLGDREYIQFAAQPGRTHGCTVGRGGPVAGRPPGRVHTHSPR